MEKKFRVTREVITALWKTANFNNVNWRAVGKNTTAISQEVGQTILESQIVSCSKDIERFFEKLSTARDMRDSESDISVDEYILAVKDAKRAFTFLFRDIVFISKNINANTVKNYGMRVRYSAVCREFRKAWN